MNFWRSISARGALSDLVELWRAPQPHRWQILGLAVAATFALMMLFIPESQRIAPARPSVTYITTWEEGRTDAEILASNLANQQRKEERAAREAARIERRKELYRALGRATGLDVDEMEREIARQEAADAAAKAAQLREIEARRTEAPAAPVAGE